jgi:CelD/BcsL family acetyltransferase involved in cellulose biosynthesis
MNFTLIQTPSDFDALAAGWNFLLAESVTNVPFLRHEYLRAWWSTLGGGEWPRGELAIVAATENGRLAGIAPLFLTDNLDGQPALMLLGSLEISDYLDLIARPADLPAFVGGLLDFLVHSGPSTWRALDWYNVPETSPTLPLLRAEAEKRGWAFTQEPFRPALSVPLPGDFEVYLASIDKKQRHEIRRKMRRIYEFGLPVRWYIVEDEATLDAEMDGFLALMANDPAKAAFLTEAMRSQMHAGVHAAFRAGWLQLAFLAVNGEKAAGYLNFDYNNHIWVYNSAIDYKYLELSPGWVLLGHLLEWANENKRAEFDFMRGNEDYKYRFGGVERFVVRAKVMMVNASA